MDKAKGAGRRLYARLALQNMRKNTRTYLPYIITCVCAVSMFYIVYALSRDPSAGQTVSLFLRLGTWVMGIFSVVFLFYTNSFLMKRRKKEFGLFNVLGMEKRHIARIVTYENLFTFTVSIVAGLGCGLLLFKLVHLILLSMLQFDFRFGFSISISAIRTTLVLFLGIFLLLLVSSLWQIGRARPIELMRDAQAGEREPKARWLLALAGLLCLGGGYWISVTTQDPVAVVMLFFGAVILVIVGTYLLFIAGGVAFLKLLKRNKRYYYKANHFISVSGMMYRMKQNAAGLATICILATMVLVMISSTAALYFGMEGALEERYIREIVFTTRQTDDESIAVIRDTVRDKLAAAGLTPENEMGYRMMSTFGHREGNAYIIDGMYDTQWDIADLYFIPLEDYLSFADEPVTLEEGEALLLSTIKPYGAENLTLLGKTFQLREEYETFEPFNLSGTYNTDMTPVYTLVVRDTETILELQAILETVPSAPYAVLKYLYGYDLTADDELEYQVRYDTLDAIAEQGVDCTLESRSENRQEFLEMYGGLFFLGLFLGFVFILATVLIIYYKQVSEGYDDRRRYAIMQKVGLSRREVKRAINSQILTIFILPLIAACLHIAFAFPAIRKMLLMLNLHDVRLFILTTLLSVAVFSVFYVIVYGLTAKVYYGLVESEGTA